MTVSQPVRYLAVALLALSGTQYSLANEIAPGRITNPGGFQTKTYTAYNSANDEYLIVYSGTRPGLAQPAALGRRLSPSGTLLGTELILSPASFVQGTSIAYNPDRNEYLVVWRNDQPQDIFGRYLDGNGNPMGGFFGIATSGQSEVDAEIAYSTVSKRYMVLWQENRSGTKTIVYQMIDGDSTSGTPLIGGEVTVESGALSSEVAYGSASNNQFLVVFQKETANKADLFCRLIAGDGSGPTSGVIRLTNDPGDQSTPRIAHSSSNNRWLVTFADRERAASQNADVSALLINSGGGVVKRFFIIATPKAGNPVSGGWDVPGSVTYNSLTGTFFATWRLEPKAWGREVNPSDGSLGPAIFLSDQDAWVTSAAARPVISDPQALAVWRSSVGEDGVHAGIVHLPRPVATLLTVDTPSPNDFLAVPFPVSGWAIDLEATSGTGVDAVAVWAFPQTGGAPINLGLATLGIERLDVGAIFGDQFTNSGYSLNVSTPLADGFYTLVVFARSTVSGKFDAAREINVRVGSAPLMVVDTPSPGATVSGGFEVSGWALDRAAPSGTGVEAVAVWAIPQAGGANIFLGLATLGIERPGIGEIFGDQFTNSGYRLEVTTILPNGNYTLVVFAKSTVTGTFNNSKSVPITVQVVSDPHMALDVPKPGATVPIPTLAMPFLIGGWAVDLGAFSGTGVDAVAVWAIPQGGGANIFLGLATLGIERPGIGALFGPQFTFSGYGLVVRGGLPAGNYTLVVFARSTMTGTYNNSRAVAISVSP